MKRFTVFELERAVAYHEREWEVDAETFEEAVEILECKRPSKGVRRIVIDNRGDESSDIVVYGETSDAAYEQLADARDVAAP